MPDTPAKEEPLRLGHFNSIADRSYVPNAYVYEPSDITKKSLGVQLINTLRRFTNSAHRVDEVITNAQWPGIVNFQTAPSPEPAVDKYGDPVRKKNPGNVTPLMIAAQHADTGAINTLIQHKARVNMRDENGDTALDYIYAAKFDYTQVTAAKTGTDFDTPIRLLLKNGAMTGSNIDKQTRQQQMKNTP
jgi:ankyrin repeat protein